MNSTYNELVLLKWQLAVLFHCCHIFDLNPRFLKWSHWETQSIDTKVNQFFFFREQQGFQQKYQPKKKKH